MASRRQFLRELSWRKCRGASEFDLDALMFFCRTYVKIQHPERGSINFDLRPAQEEILDTWLHERQSIVLKARQIGWSTLVAVYALWLTLFWPDRIVVMLSATERDAEKLLFKGTYAYDRLPEWMRDRGPKRLTKNLKKLAFDNGSSIESLPSKENPARGTAVTLVVVDEWAFLENSEEAWASIEPISDVGGRVIGLSTANGAGNFFHTWWNMAVAGENDFKPMFYPWWANDERDANWYATKQRTMLEWQLHQEYPSNPEEAFIKSGNPVFDIDALSKLATGPGEPGYLDVTQSRNRPEWRYAPDMPYSLWEEPDPKDAYVIGADVAEGLEHGDYSEAYVISVRELRIVANFHGHIPADTFGEELYALGMFYNTAFLGVESNNHGLSTLHQLQRMRYPRLYYRRTIDARTKKMLAQVGWYTSKPSKLLMIDELGKALRENLIVEDPNLVGQLKTFVRDEKGQMHGSPFDDRVMAAAIAVQMLDYQSVREEVVDDDPAYIPGTYAYFARRAREADEPENLPMGYHNRTPE